MELESYKLPRGNTQQIIPTQFHERTTIHEANPAQYQPLPPFNTDYNAVKPPSYSSPPQLTFDQYLRTEIKFKK